MSACYHRHRPMAQKSITPNVYALDAAFAVVNPESQQNVPELI